MTKLMVFVKDGRIALDNNRSERSIKPFVIGRKNWLFANTPRCATASTVIYSVIETVNYVFEQMPQLSDPNDA